MEGSGAFIQEPPAPDPRDVVFGFGRRACAGRAFADSNVWLAAAAIVATFTIDRVRDEHGREVIPSAEFTDGVVRCASLMSGVALSKLMSVCGACGGGGGGGGEQNSHAKPFRCAIAPRSSREVELVDREYAEVEGDSKA